MPHACIINGYASAWINLIQLGKRTIKPAVFKPTDQLGKQRLFRGILLAACQQQTKKKSEC